MNGQSTNVNRDYAIDYLTSLQNSTPQKSASDYSIGTPRGDVYKRNLLSILNPRNWNVDSYSSGDGLSFGEAYKHARNNGRDEFMFDNKRYSTKYNGTPQEQLSQTGTTDEQLQPKSFIRDRLANNLAPLGYDRVIPRLFNAVIMNRQDPRKKDISYKNDSFDRYQIDANNLYFGKPQEYNEFIISKYKPTTGNKNQNYYSINDNLDESNERRNAIYDAAIDYLGNGGEFPFRGAYMSDVGSATIDRGEDANGKYFSVYDKWDLAPPIRIGTRRYHIDIPIQADTHGKPWELYQRYYDKDFDTTKVNNEIAQIKNSKRYNYEMSFRKRTGLLNSYSEEEEKIKRLEQHKRKLLNLFSK